ncbi:MAG TPA: glycosyltransferase family 2 protein [Flavisolibacter sp.]|nr:glycosyltransferase family 2 protein [Flavisolibacter sp.]
MSALPSVAIVILNWNGKQFLEKFLPYVFNTDYANYKVVVADNASTDDSVAFLQHSYRQVELIILPENYGFAGGYNKALAHVKADYYVLLNSDVEVTPGWLRPIIDLLEESEINAACQPKLLAYDNRDCFEYAGAAGGWLDLYGYPFARGRVFNICERDFGQYDSTEEIFWASGAALVIKSKVYHELNGFDQYFFAHQEEIDLCWRIKTKGYKIFCCVQSVVYHVGGGTLPRTNSRKTFLNFRNNHILLAKNLPLREKFWKIPFRLMLDQLSALKGLIHGDGGYFIAIIKAHWAFYYWILSGRRDKLNMINKPLKSMSGVYKGNIAWKHFVKHKKLFSEIVLKKER